MNEKFIPTTELLQLNPVTFVNFADFERIKLPKLNGELFNLNDPLIFLNNSLHVYAIPLGLRVTIVPYDLMFYPATLNGGPFKEGSNCDNQHRRQQHPWRQETDGHHQGL